MGTEAIVIEDQMLERYMRREKGDQGRLCVEPKSIVVQVDGMKIRERE